MGRKKLINGNILIYKELNYKDLVSYADISPDSHFDKTIDGDLIVDDTYDDDFITDIYYATGDIVTYSNFPENNLMLIYSDFNSELCIINRLIDSSITTTNKEKETLYRLLYINVISSLETLLANTLLYSTSINKTFLSRYVSCIQKDMENKYNEKYNPSDTQWQGRIRGWIIEYFYINTTRVSEIYKMTFDITCSKNKDIDKFFQIRNDLAHRNGYSKGRDEDRKRTIITECDLKNIIKVVSSYVDDIIGDVYYKVFPRI